MSEADFNKVVDAFLEAQNKHIGEVIVPNVGAYPRQPGLGWYAQVFNEFVTTDLIRHYADAMGDRNPLWRSNDYARGTIWGGIIAPPTFTDSIAASWPGAGRENRVGELKFKLESALAGARRQWFQAIRPWDRFRIVDKYLGLVERKPKQPRPYRMFIDTVQRKYINQKDETVAVVDCRQSVLAFPSAELLAGMSGAGRQRRKLTDEERDAIYRGYDTETRRGAQVLFWEDVAVGEELKPLVVGPVSVWDVVAFFAALAGEPTAFDVLWEMLKLEPTHAYLDPEVNAWKVPGEGHFKDGAGITGSMTGGYAVAPGPQIDGLICRMLCNWMGDYGFLKMLDTQYRTVPILGDVFRSKGKVTNKSIEGDEHLVDLELYCENMDGLVLVPATARVRLPSRTEL